jgi:hypothetical protein
MKKKQPLCSFLLLIGLALGANPVHLYADVYLERRSRSDSSSTVLRNNKIEPFVGWHYVVTNRSATELTIMVEIEGTYGPEEGFNRYIVFDSQSKEIHIGVGLAETIEPLSPSKQYEFQLYAFDGIGFKSDKRSTTIHSPQGEKIEDYIDTKQDIEFNKRQVLGEFLIIDSTSHVDEGGNMRQPDGPIGPETKGFVVKLSATVYKKK